MNAVLHRKENTHNDYNDNNSKHKTYKTKHSNYYNLQSVHFEMQYQLNYLKKVSTKLFYYVLTFLKNTVPDQWQTGWNDSGHWNNKKYFDNE